MATEAIVPDDWPDIDSDEDTDENERKNWKKYSIGVTTQVSAEEEWLHVDSGGTSGDDPQPSASNVVILSEKRKERSHDYQLTIAAKKARISGNENSVIKRVNSVPVSSVFALNRSEMIVPFDRIKIKRPFIGINGRYIADKSAFVSHLL